MKINYHRKFILFMKFLIFYLSLCFLGVQAMEREAVLDPKTCGKYRHPSYLTLLSYEKNKRPLNRLFIIIKVDENCQIDPQSPLPDFYWIMGEKEKKGVIPCQGLDSDDFEYWFPYAPGSQLDMKNQRAFKAPFLQNDERGLFVLYTMGMMKMVTQEWAGQFPGETLGKNLRIETFRDERGECAARQWTILHKGEKKEKIWINYIYLRMALNLLVNASWNVIDIRGKTESNQNFQRLIQK